MKKSFISNAVALALALGSFSAQAVVIDTAGGSGAGTLLGGASAVYDVTALDWRPDNALAIGALSTPTLGAGGPGGAGQNANESWLQNVAQGTLAGFGTTSGPLATEIFANTFLQGREFTFQASFYTYTSGIGTGTVTNRLGAGDSYFRVYADTNIATKSNVITGSGYGADAGAVLVLEGTLSALNGIFQDKTRGEGLGTQTLDSFDENGAAPLNTDYQNGVQTNVGNGSNTLTVNINYLNSAYFLGDVDQLLLTLNYTDTTNLATPFVSTTPSDAIVGWTPAYSVTAGGLVNGADCNPRLGGATETGTPVARCDFHFQSDASGSFIERPLPEPASLALVGLALGGVGFVARRRGAKKA